MPNRSSPDSQAAATPTTERTTEHGLQAVRLRSADGAEALVGLHGAHVLSWRPAPVGTGAAQEQLYLSPRSGFAAGQAIRGGVPVIFPQFSNRGPLQRHGFVRNLPWQLAHAGADGDAAVACLRLTDDASTQAAWPHAFQLELLLRVSGDALDMTLHVRNTGTTPLSFSAALHTYLQVARIDQVVLEGLESRDYLDSVTGQHRTQDATGLRIAGEVDRIYFDAPAPLQLREHGGTAPRLLQLRQSGFEDVVVWNPGAEKCAALADMPAEGFQQMVCIEAARIARPVTLVPGGDWRGTQQLRVVG